MRCIPPIEIRDHPVSNIYRAVPTPHYSALLRNYSASVAKGMFIFPGENRHFVKGHGVGKGVE